MRAQLLVLVMMAGTAMAQQTGGGGVPGAAGSGVPTLAANTFTAAQTAPGFFLQAKAAGPYSVLFDDYYSGANTASNSIGTPANDSCAVSDHLH